MLPFDQEAISLGKVEETKQIKASQETRNADGSQCKGHSSRDENEGVKVTREHSRETTTASSFREDGKREARNYALGSDNRDVTLFMVNPFFREATRLLVPPSRCTGTCTSTSNHGDPKETKRSIEPELVAMEANSSAPDTSKRENNKQTNKNLQNQRTQSVMPCTNTPGAGFCVDRKPTIPHLGFTSILHRQGVGWRHSGLNKGEDDVEVFPQSSTRTYARSIFPSPFTDTSTSKIHTERAPLKRRPKFQADASGRKYKKKKKKKTTGGK